MENCEWKLQRICTEYAAQPQPSSSFPHQKDITVKVVRGIKTSEKRLLLTDHVHQRESC